MEDFEQKVFFNPGDLVKIKHDLDYVPTMYVIEKAETTYMKDNVRTKFFLGIKCRWFDKNYQIQESIFSSKDLIHIK